MHVVTGSSFFGSSTRTFLFLIKLLISFKVTLSQGFFMSSENVVTSETFLGSEIIWETSETYFPMVEIPAKYLLQQS